MPPDKGGEERVGKRGKRRGREKTERGLTSVPTVPNLPLHHWSILQRLRLTSRIEKTSRSY